MTAALCPATLLTMDALEAMPGPEGLPDPVAISMGEVDVPQESGGLGTVVGGYCQRMVPWLAPVAQIA